MTRLAVVVRLAFKVAVLAILAWGVFSILVPILVETSTEVPR